MARPICFMLLRHCMRRAASRAAWTAGKSRAIRTAMMAITTNSSISVKPREGLGRVVGRFDMTLLRNWGVARRRSEDGAGSIAAGHNDLIGVGDLAGGNPRGLPRVSTRRRAER